MDSFPLPPPPQDTNVPPFPFTNQADSTGSLPIEPAPLASAPTLPAPDASPQLPTFSPPPSADVMSPPPPPLSPEPPLGDEPPMPASIPVQKSPFNLVTPLIIGGVVLAIIIAVVVGLVIPALQPKTATGPAANAPTSKAVTPVTLTYYGLWEPKEVMQPVIDEFQKQNPNIKVDYQMQESTDYRERLQTLLAGKATPDIVRFHSTWIPMFISSLSTAPTTAITTTELTANFYPAVTDAVSISGQIFAVPTTMEGLALFVNQQIIDTAGVTVPTDWAKFRDLSQQLTQYDPATKQITRAGVALGTTNNIDHWPDIVSLMLLQAGVDMKNPETKSTGDALSFYTWFSTTGNVWNTSFPNSVQAFAAGKVAMIFAPSWRALDIQTLNPSLKWKIYPVPQLPESPVVNWANFWVEGVPKNSTHQTEAWTFVKFLASSQAQQLMFNAASAQRGFGQLPANKALAETVASNPIVGPFAIEANTAKTFYTTSFTMDGVTGINSRLNVYLGDAVNSLNLSPDPSRVVPTLQSGFNQVLSQYGIVAPLTTPGAQ